MLRFFSGLAFASGLSATTTIVHTLKAGDHILSTDDVYGGTNRYVFLHEIQSKKLESFF